MLDTHSRQLISADDILIEYSIDGNNYYPVPFVGNYGLVVEWAGKEFIPVPELHTEDVKITSRAKLDLAIDQNKDFQLPEDCWIKVSLFLNELANGDRWYWARSAQYKQLSKSEKMIISGVNAIQYQLVSNGTFLAFNELRYATLFTQFKASSSSPIQFLTAFNASTHVFLLN
jgi:hypothetical protein